MKTCERTWWGILLLLFFAFPLTGNTAEFELELVSSWPVGKCTAVDNTGDIVYFSSGKYLRIVDFTNYNNPVEMNAYYMQALQDIMEDIKPQPEQVEAFIEKLKKGDDSGYDPTMALEDFLEDFKYFLKYRY